MCRAHIINAVDERVDTAVTHSENMTGHPNVIDSIEAVEREKIAYYFQDDREV